jgi:hypothetical protein
MHLDSHLLVTLSCFSCKSNSEYLTPLVIFRRISGGKADLQTLFESVFEMLNLFKLLLISAVS